MRSGQDYIALPTQASTDDLLELEYLPTSKAPRRDWTASEPQRDRSNRLIFWATVCVVCSTLLSFAITLASTINSPAAPSALHPSEMKRPNPFVNLDRILAANATFAFDPILNFPPIALQIATSDSDRHMHEDTRERQGVFGTVYPDDRHIIISREVSTIIQFRNLDYGMEHCALHFEVPSPFGRFDPTVNLTEHSQADIWVLESSTELSRYIPGSMDRAPKRRNLLTTFLFSATEATHFGTFDCPSGEFTTLELTCSSTNSPCNVDFWQDRRAKPRGGIYMIQYPSRIRKTTE